MHIKKVSGTGGTQLQINLLVVVVTRCVSPLVCVESLPLSPYLTVLPAAVGAVLNHIGNYMGSTAPVLQCQIILHSRVVVLAASSSEVIYLKLLFLCSFSQVLVCV